MGVLLYKITACACARIEVAEGTRDQARIPVRAPRTYACVRISRARTYARAGKYSDAYAISVVAIWSFSLASFRIQRLRAINHAAAVRRAAKLRP